MVRRNEPGRWPRCGDGFGVCTGRIQLAAGLGTPRICSSGPPFLFNISSSELPTGLRFYSSLELVKNVLRRIRPHLVYNIKGKPPNCHKETNSGGKLHFFGTLSPLKPTKSFCEGGKALVPGPHPGTRPPRGTLTGVNLGPFGGKGGPSEQWRGAGLHQCFPQA